MDAIHNLHDQDPLMASRRGPEVIGHHDGPGDTGTEADAVVRSGDVIVHGLGYGDDLHALLVKSDPVAQRVVTPDRDQIVDSKPLQVLRYSCLSGVLEHLLLAYGSVGSSTSEETYPRFALLC